MALREHFFHTNLPRRGKTCHWERYAVLSVETHVGNFPSRFDSCSHRRMRAKPPCFDHSVLWTESLVGAMLSEIRLLRCFVDLIVAVGLAVGDLVEAQDHAPTTNAHRC